MKKFFLTLFILFGLIACGKKDTPSLSNPTNNNQVLNIIAGSELKDMEPILNEVSKKTGIKLKIEYVGTIDGVERIKQKQPYDVAWFSQSKYFHDTSDNNLIKQSEKIMYSPVVIGMRKTSYIKSKLNNMTQITWNNIYELVEKNNFTYAMTDPSSSNTGYSALMGIAYSTANKSEALDEKDINVEKMKTFFKGHLVNSGSSGWLLEAFKHSKADFVINYESVLLKYNQENPQDQLQIIYPYEGIITADYPILLINNKKIDDYKNFINELKQINIQKQILNLTSRRLFNSELTKESTKFNNHMLIEMPFNPSLQLSDKLLTAYFSEYKKPAAIVFVIDTSGSMNTVNNFKGQKIARIDAVKQAIEELTIQNKNSYAQFRNREKIWILPFSSETYNVYNYNLTSDIEKNKILKQNIFNDVNQLQPDGGTALFSATMNAVFLLQKEQKINQNYQYSIIVLTDGQANSGISASEFNKLISKTELSSPIRVFPILFGEAVVDELKSIAQSTGGKVFDSQNKTLSEVFKEIRTYQ